MYNTPFIITQEKIKEGILKLREQNTSCSEDLADCLIVKVNLLRKSNSPHKKKFTHLCILIIGGEISLWNGK